MEHAHRQPGMEALTAALAAPFEPREVKFKPQMVKNNRCLAMAYIDARLIQDRLDERQADPVPRQAGAVRGRRRADQGGRLNGQVPARVGLPEESRRPARG
jgi:hypothetical protein